MPIRLPFLDRSPAVAVVRLEGMIAAGARGLSDKGLAPLLERAFRRGRPKAVALVVNSPGGSAVQSALIASRIRRLSEEREVPVVAFVEDLAASGGYWLATAADEIWVDESSLVGSIGVIYAGFGFHGLLDRYGVERRVHTAGRSKSFMDPFSPEKKADVARLKALQEPIHASFIGQVKARRGARLAEGQDLFTGDIWTGAQAVELGLADRVGHLVPAMKERFGKDVRFLEYGRKRPLLQRLGATFTDEVSGALEERAMWARFGL
jgi:serine protease SohB